jgi:Ca2+-binding EF-hand superfamily protein
MSNTEEKPEEKNALQEVSNKVNINVEDCTGAAEFWKHFNVEMPPELKDAFDKFAKEPTFVNQQEIKLAVCKAIGFTDHEAFHDEMFKEIVEECHNIVYDLSFDKSLEATLDKEEDKQTP